MVGAGNSFGRPSGGQGGGCTKSRGGVTFAAAATALGAGGLNSRTTSRPKRLYIWGRSGDCVQVWSDEGAATQQGLQPSGAGASTRPGFLRRLGTGAAPTEATGAAGDRPRPPMQHLSLTLGGEAMVGGKQRGKELQIAERLRREPRDPDQVLARCMQPQKWASRPRGGFFLLVSRLTPRRDDRGRDLDTDHLPRAGELAAPRNPRHQIAQMGAIAGPETVTVRVRVRETPRKAGWRHLGQGVQTDRR